METLNSVFYFITQTIKVYVVILPGIMPNVAFFLEYRKGNPFCWFWLFGGMTMAIGVLLTL